MPEYKSEGQRLLCGLPGTPLEIAAAIGFRNEGPVHAWLDGTRSPAANARTALSKVFAIPNASWTARPGATLPTERKPPPAPPARPTPLPDSLDHCQELLTEIREARKTPNLKSNDRAKLAMTEVRIMTMRNDLERRQTQRIELSEARYVREHPAWRALKSKLVDVLKKHPQAAKDVMAAIQEGDL